jgi:hypothetical protein
MSFSDFTSPSSTKKTTQSSTAAAASIGISTDESNGSSGSKALTIISDALLQYQVRNCSNNGTVQVQPIQQQQRKQ